MRNPIIILDTRNKKDAFVKDSIEQLGYRTYRSKLPFGDVAFSNDILNVVDLKSSGGGLIELAMNICGRDHARLVREIRTIASYGGKLTFLCFEPGIHCVDDVIKWKVPRFKRARYYKGHLIAEKGELMTKVKPETLMKSMKTMSKPNIYGNDFTVHFEFTTKRECGKKIIEILRRNENE